MDRWPCRRLVVNERDGGRREDEESVLHWTNTHYIIAWIIASFLRVLCILLFEAYSAASAVARKPPSRNIKRKENVSKRHLLFSSDEDEAGSMRGMM